MCYDKGVLGCLGVSYGVLGCLVVSWGFQPDPPLPTNRESTAAKLESVFKNESKQRRVNLLLYVVFKRNRQHKDAKRTNVILKQKISNFYSKDFPIKYHCH